MLCLSELRGLQEFQAKHPETVVVAIAVTDDRAAVEKLLKSRKLTSLRVVLGKEWQQKFGLADTLPATVLVSGGKIRVVHDSVLLDPVAELEEDAAAIH